MDDYYFEPSTIESCKRKREAQTEKIELSSSSKLSNFPINNMPDSLLIEILIRLPNAISATRCKSVCKLWFSLLSTHYFVHRFLHHHNNTRPFTLIINYIGNDPYYNEELLLTSKDQLFNSPRFKLTYLPCFNNGICILASFNDLLLCCASKKDHSVYYICNPLTMQWLALPPTPNNYKHETRIHVGFICDQYAYRNEQGEYRYAVMRIHVLINGFSAVEIFSSETGNWKEYNVLSPQKVRWIQNDISAVAYNGMLHWLTVDGYIIAYNPYNIEQCQFIDCPKVTKPENFSSYLIWNRLGVCCGFLRILQLLTLPFGHAQNLTVWELKDYNKSEWRLMYKVNLNEMISNSSWVLKYIEGKKTHIFGNYIASVDRRLILRVATQAFHPNNGDIVYLGFANHLVSCNMQRRKLNVVSKIPCESDLFDSNLFPLVLPWWPTPVPRLPCSDLS